MENIPGKTLEELKAESEAIGKQIDRDKRIWRDYGVIERHVADDRLFPYDWLVAIILAIAFIVAVSICLYGCDIGGDSSYTVPAPTYTIDSPGRTLAYFPEMEDSWLAYPVEGHGARAEMHVIESELRWSWGCVLIALPDGPLLPISWSPENQGRCEVWVGGACVASSSEYGNPMIFPQGKIVGEEVASE